MGVKEIPTSFGHVRLSQPSIYQREHLDILSADLSQRAAFVDCIRREFFASEVRAYFEDPDIIHSYEIFTQKLAPHLDQIYLAQREQGYKKGEQKSWFDYDPVESAALRVAIRDLTADHPDNPFRDFFSRNEDTRQTLRIIGEEVLIETNPNRLKNLGKELEGLAIQSYQKGKPVFLFLMSHFYTSPDDYEGDSPRILEADARLVIPLRGRTKHTFEKVEKESWQRLRHIHPIKKPGKYPVG